MLVLLARFMIDTDSSGKPRQVVRQRCDKLDQLI